MSGENHFSNRWANRAVRTVLTQPTESNATSLNWDVAVVGQGHYRRRRADRISVVEELHDVALELFRNEEATITVNSGLEHVNNVAGQIAHNTLVADQATFSEESVGVLFRGARGGLRRIRESSLVVRIALIAQLGFASLEGLTTLDLLSELVQIGFELVVGDLLIGSQIPLLFEREIVEGAHLVV